MPQRQTCGSFTKNTFAMMKPQLTYYDISPDTTAFSTTRHGGHSTGNYAELNINRYCGDNPEDIEKNLEDLCRELGVDKERVIMPHQTHGTEVMQIGADFLSLSATVKGMILEGVDALITDVKDVCIGVSTADCIPILIYDYAHHAAAAVHAGWRGTVKRIACKAVKMMEVSFGSRPEDLTAVIGPGISIDAFEVGDEVYAEFEAAGFNMADISRQEDKWHIDLPECNRRQLAAMGLKENNINVSWVCTYNNSNDYFSARKLGTESGRIFTGIILR